MRKFYYPYYVGSEEEIGCKEQTDAGCLGSYVVALDIIDLFIRDVVYQQLSQSI